MSELLEIVEQIKQKIFDLLSQVQTTKKVDNSAYQAICKNLDNA